MANYTHEYSNFPSSILNMNEFKDINATVLPRVMEFNTYIKNGNVSAAMDIYNKYNLDDYFVNSVKLNTILESIRNTQIYAKTKGQQIIYVNSISEIPDNPVDGDIYRVLKK